MSEEFRPNWDDPEGLQAGLYVWPIYCESAQLRDADKEKPYIRINAIVDDFPKGHPMRGTIPNKNFKFDFRVYLSAKSKGFAMYFMKKFGYPEALLGDGKHPRIISSEFSGLWGQVLAEVKEDNFGQLKINIMGYGHLGDDQTSEGNLFKRRENELEKRAREAGEQQEEAPVQEEPPARDLEEDVSSQQAPVGREPGEDLPEPSDDPFASFN